MLNLIVGLTFDGNKSVCWVMGSLTSKVVTVVDSATHLTYDPFQRTQGIKGFYSAAA